MIIDGKMVAQKRLDLVRKQIDDIRAIRPCLATVLVGEDPGSKMYVRMKHEACEKVHIGSVKADLPATATTGQVLEKIRELNNDQSVDGILVQLPLPTQVDTARSYRQFPRKKMWMVSIPAISGFSMQGHQGSSHAHPRGS